tara:strand:+ start:138 stop:350 length:213 start_codon:yes stop_codon:yes gene_type:complete
MNKIESINEAMRIIRAIEPPVEFETFMDINIALKHCKKILRKGDVKKESTTTIKSKALKEWRDSWFGKEK